MFDVACHLTWLPTYILTTDLSDEYMLRRAYLYANGSPDPRTKNGAVLVNPKGYVIGYAANRFPWGVQATEERIYDRETKLAMIVHAEQGAILKAAKFGRATDKSTLYCPFYACSECAKAIIQAGINRVVGHAQLMAIARHHEAWKQSIQIGFKMMKEAGVQLYLYNGHLEVSARFNGASIRV